MKNQKQSGILHQFAVGSFYVLVGNVVGLGIQFGLRILLGRYFGPHEYGMFVLGIILLNISVLISLLGLNPGVAQRIPQVDDPQDVFLSALIVVLPVSIAMGGIVLFYSRIIAFILSEPGLVSIIVPFSFAIPFLALMRLSVGGFRGMSDGKGQMLVQINYVFVAIPVIIGIFISTDLTHITIFWVSGIVIASAVSVIHLYRRTSLLEEVTPQSLVKYGNNPIYIKELTWFSIPLMLSGLLSKLIQQIDNYIVGYFLGSLSVGLYDAAFTITIGILLFSRSAGFLSVPMFSELYNNGQKMNEIYKRVTKFLVFLTLPLILVLIFYGNILLTAIYGPEYNQINLLVPIIAIGLYTHIILGPNQSVLIAVEEPFQVLISNFCALAVNIILNIMLIPEWGIIGAATSSAMTYLLWNLYMSYIIYNKTGVQPFHRQYTLTFTTSLFSFIIIKEVFSNFLPSPKRILITISVYLAIHLSIVYLAGLSLKEKKIVTTQLKMEK